jgi:hypothetical protein
VHPDLERARDQRLASVTLLPRIDSPLRIASIALPRRARRS